jgi:hypothetical protein
VVQVHVGPLFFSGDGRRPTPERRPSRIFLGSSTPSLTRNRGDIDTLVGFERLLKIGSNASRGSNKLAIPWQGVEGWDCMSKTLAATSAGDLFSTWRFITSPRSFVTRRASITYRLGWLRAPRR